MFSIAGILKRIQSFTAIAWPITINKFSPYKCAQYGYSNTGINQIQCDVCHEVITINDQDYDMDEWDYQKSQQLGNDFVQKLKASHAIDCFYTNLEYVEKINLNFFYKEWQKYYNESLESYHNITNELPIIDPSIKDILTEKDFDILWDSSYIMRTTYSIHVPTILALFGWKLIITEKPEKFLYFLCQFCGRNIPFTAFKTKPSLIQNLSETDPSSINDTENFLFNVIDDHRYFCKWCPDGTSSIKQNGWQIVLEMLKYQKFTNKPFNNLQESSISMESIEVANKDSISKEQTKYKLEILNTVQELSLLRERTLRKCEDILKISENMELNDTDIIHEKPDIRKTAEELGINIDPVKKMKM